MAYTLSLSPTATPFPYGILGLASFISESKIVAVEIAFTTENASSLTVNGKTITDYDEIWNILVQEAHLSGESSKAAPLFALSKAIATTTVYTEIVTALDALDDHLRFRTFLVGHSLSAPDWSVWGSLKVSSQAQGVIKRGQHAHISRWLSYIDSLESSRTALTQLTEAKASKFKSQQTASSFALGLEGAEDGKVVTRFPPEPSGYLHIGHAKAAILNEYFAHMYHGKLIVRFDDTNPAKETTEFEQTILEDLDLLGIHGDVITHTSDYFELLYKYAVQLIKSGKGYADDTEQLQMRAERMDGIPSKRRDSTVEDNLKRFEEMKLGTEEGQKWCIRAKISFDNPNKALRDPVVYRCQLLPHHRTGSLWKIYPTYDFACPIVDSIEGVTHALRTNEYRDRNPQYQWMLKALELRKVRVWDFSRVNFIYTLLSKRKLMEFVKKGLVQGWDDPRFPTVRGIRRRGMTIDAIRQFMLAQGPSQTQIMLEWDQIWSANKRIIDPIAPRFWALNKDKLVKLTINGGPSSVQVKAVPKHKKNPDVGMKETAYSSSILVEQEDAHSFDDNEEITLMDWGNSIIRSKTKTSSGDISAISMDLHLEGDFKKTKKKITWLASPTAVHPLANVTLLDYDYLITKKKLEEGDDVNNYLTPVTEFRTEALADANVLKLSKGTIIQFERKGYYILDRIVEEKEGKRLEFITIPDGRAAGLASKAGAATETPTTSKAKDSAPAPPPSKAATASSSESAPQLAGTKMYDVERIYAKDLKPQADTQMYRVASVYDSPA